MKRIAAAFLASGLLAAGAPARADWAQRTVLPLAYLDNYGTDALVRDANGIIHLIVRGSDYPYYVRFDGVTVASEPVVLFAPFSIPPLGNVALDRDGNPAFAFSAGPFGSVLTLARRFGVTWSSETVVNEGAVNLGQSKRLAFDSQNRPRILYSRSSDCVLKYASFDGVSWSTETIATPTNCALDSGPIQLALDASGTPHAAYLDRIGTTYAGYVVNYAHRTGPGTWGIETIPNSGGGDSNHSEYSNYFSFALDRFGNPHVLRPMDYGTNFSISGNDEYANLTYFRKISGVWSSELFEQNTQVCIRSTCNGTYYGYGLSMTLDSQSNLYAIYTYYVYNPNPPFGFTAAGFKFAKKAGGFLTKETLNNNSDDSGQFTAIAVDAAATPHVVYQASAGGLVYLRRNSAPSLAFAGGTGYESSGVSPLNGLTSSTFTFKVKYSDPEGDAPKSGYPKLHVLKGGSEIAGSPFLLTSPAGSSFVSGKTYSYQLGLSTGTDYSYYFEAFDTLVAQAAGDLSATQLGPNVGKNVLAFTGESGYATDGVSPDTGTPISTFTFRVSYADAGGQAPKSGYPKLYLLKGASPVAGSPFTMLDTSSGTYAAGRLYSYAVSLSTGSDYTYYFQALDPADVVAAGSPTSPLGGPVVLDNQKPALSFTGEPNFVSRGVNLTSGDALTLYIYRIKYADPEGDPPQPGTPKLHILKGGGEITGSPVAMAEADAGAFVSGRIYSFSTNLAQGTDYTYSFEAYDQYGNPATGSTGALTGPQVSAPAAGGGGNVGGTAPPPETVSNDVSTAAAHAFGAGPVLVETPPFTFPASFTLSLTTPASLPAAGDPGLGATGVGVEVQVSPPMQPLKDLTLSVGYRDSDVAGLDESRLVLAYYDATRARWVQIPSTPDPAGNRVVGTARHLTTFQIFQLQAAASLSGATAYPNPYKPGSGGDFDNSTSGAGIVFSGLPARATIKIYTLSGTLVRTIEETDGDGSSLWDIRNSDGDQVASGVYFYLITSPGAGKARGRIAIIK